LNHFIPKDIPFFKLQPYSLTTPSEKKIENSSWDWIYETNLNGTSRVYNFTLAHMLDMSTVISIIQFRNGHFYLLPNTNFDKREDSEEYMKIMATNYICLNQKRKTKSVI